MSTENKDGGRLFAEFRGFSLIRFLVLIKFECYKMINYWAIRGGYIAMIGIALIASYLTFHIEQAAKLTSGSGYAFAIGLMMRGIDIGAVIIFLMITMLFSTEMTFGTIKNILGRPVTRMEMMMAKYITSWMMVMLAIGIFLSVGLAMGAFYYGLGDLTEDGYVLFSKWVMFKEMFIALCFQMVPFMAVSALAMMISSFSSTMGGAMIIGVIAYFFFDLVGIIPSNLGFHIKDVFVPFHVFGFPALRFVPLTILDDLPAGLPIQTWWVTEIKRMLVVCGIYFAVFFTASMVIVRRRDFTL
jgi:ABC-type transport system involved in multi-copper enzyme maturation permease subunit